MGIMRDMGFSMLTINHGPCCSLTAVAPVCCRPRTECANARPRLGPLGWIGCRLVPLVWAWRPPWLAGPGRLAALTGLATGPAWAAGPGGSVSDSQPGQAEGRPLAGLAPFAWGCGLGKIQKKCKTNTKKVQNKYKRIAKTCKTNTQKKCKNIENHAK